MPINFVLCLAMKICKKTKDKETLLMNYRIYLSLVTIMVILFTGVIIGQIPETLPYQGRIIDADAKPLVGPHNVTFVIYQNTTLYDSLWYETHACTFDSVEANGLYTVMLGSITPFPDTLDFSEGYWLAISVDGDDEMTPRYQLGTSPYAMRAKFANDAISADTAGFATHTTFADSADYAAHAKFADSAGYVAHATRADTADFASNTGNVEFADSARVAHHAGSADSAGVALRADNATFADAADHAIYADSHYHGLEDHYDIDLTGLQDENFLWWLDADSLWHPVDIESLLAAWGFGGGGSGQVKLINDVVGSGWLDTDVSTEIAPNAVGSPEIADDAVKNSEIADNAVKSPEIAAAAVGGAASTAEIKNSSIVGHGSTFESDIKKETIVGHSETDADIKEGTVVGHGAAKSDIKKETIVGHSETDADIKEETVVGHGAAKSDIKGETIVGHSETDPDIKAHTIVGHAETGNVDIKLETVQGHGVAIGARSDIKEETIRGHAGIAYASEKGDITPGTIGGHVIDVPDIKANTVNIVDIYDDIVSACDGVRNDGGNIDFYPIKNIIIVPNDSLNKIGWGTSDSVDFDMITTDGLDVDGPARIGTLYVEYQSYHDGPEEYHDCIDLVNPGSPSGPSTHLDSDGIQVDGGSIGVSSDDGGVEINPTGVSVNDPDGQPLAGFGREFEEGGIEYGDMEMYAQSWQIRDRETGELNAHMHNNGELIAHSCTLESHLIVAPGADHQTTINEDGIEVARTTTEKVAGWLGKLSGLVPGMPSAVTELFSTVADGGKPALVTTADYGRRLFWCDEATELYFFDRGIDTLSDGSVTIDLDPVFLQAVTIDDTIYPYMVQVTPEADCNGLWVEKFDAYFIVHELSGGGSDTPFAWEVQAKRKDWEPVRMPEFVDP